MKAVLFENTVVDVGTLLSEEVITPKQVTRHPAFRNANGSPCHLAKVYRAMGPGYRGVRLEAFKTTTGLRTTTQAVERFIERLTNGIEGVGARTPARRHREIEKAERELANAGI